MFSSGSLAKMYWIYVDVTMFISMVIKVGTCQVSMLWHFDVYRPMF